MTTPRPHPAVAPSFPARAARVLLLRDGVVLRALELARRDVTVGRALQNDLVLDDPDKLVSRFHAEIRFEGGRYVIVDLNSQNGTWVDNQRMDRVELRAGMPVTIGPYRLIFDDTPLASD